MENRVFGKVEFNMGWETKISIHIWNSDYQITVCAASYYEDRPINELQENAYLDFFRNKDQYIKKIEEALLNQKKDSNSKYIPVLLKISQDGAAALVFDDIEDKEDGIVVCFIPKLELMSVDEFF